MAITTYAELLSAVASWAHRSDLTTIAPDFVSQCEAKLNDSLLLKDQETEATLSTAIGSDSVTLPSNYVSPIAMWIVISNARTPLTAASPQDFAGTPVNTIPRYWAIDGDSILFDNPADAVYSCPFRYVAKSNLSVTNTTNALLTRRPDLYLAGAMVEYAIWAKDTEAMAIWGSKFEDAIRAVKAADNRSKSVAPLRVDAAMQRGRSNIFAGE
ncbi:phage adaptor protein [Roseateles sp. P5_E11]